MMKQNRHFPDGTYLEEGYKKFSRKQLQTKLLKSKRKVQKVQRNLKKG